jgi:hypothetical protein
VPISTSLLGSTMVTVSLSAMVSASRSNTDMKDGIWSSYNRRAAADGIFSEVGRSRRSNDIAWCSNGVPVAQEEPDRGKG